MKRIIYTVALLLSIIAPARAQLSFQQSITGTLSPSQDYATGVTAGTYSCPNVTVNASGRTTAISNGTCSSGGTNNGLQPFPSAYIYVNPGLNAPPNQMIEFLVSPTGTDTRTYGPTTGLTPATAFASVQGCVDYIYGNFYTNGTEPVCRLMAGSYTGAVQVTGQMAGAQIDGGGQLIIWGTCPITNSPNNAAVGYSQGAADVVLKSLANGNLFSLINGAYVQATCLTASADGYAFYSQQQSNIFINTDVDTIAGPSGSTAGVLAAYNEGQIYVNGLTVIGSTSQPFAQAIFNSEIAVIGSGITFQGTPSIGGELLLAEFGGGFNIAPATLFSGAVSTPNKCSIADGGWIYTNGTYGSLPGSGSCVNSSGFLN